MSSRDSIIEILRDVSRDAKLEKATFRTSTLVPGERVPYPTNESEVDTFIKDRIKLYMDTWVVGPVDAAIQSLDEIGKNLGSVMRSEENEGFGW